LNDTNLYPPEPKKKTHWPSLGMLLLSGGGAFLSLTSAAGLVVFGLITFFGNKTGAGDSQVYFSVATASGLIFLSLLPSTILAAMRLMGKSLPSWDFPWFYRASTLGFMLVPFLIGLGFLLMQSPRLAALVLPWFQLAVVALPIWWLVETGRRELPAFSSQQGWGLFSLTITFTMPVIIIIEMILVGVIIGGILAYVYFVNPEVLQLISRSVERLAGSNLDQETALRILRPYLVQPVTIYSLIAITAGAIPFLEELLKPMALWFFAGRKLTSREGFIGGMICGAAFALLESLGALGNPGADSWPLIAIGRIGTGILHISASGLVGWGLAKAWTEGKYLSLVGAYLLAVSFHAIWNTSALMAGLKELAQFSPVLVGQFEGFILVSPIILVILAVGMVLWVMKINREFRRELAVKMN
jgi:hypothetical protein